MNNNDLQLVGAVAFALACCRGVLTEIASGQVVTKEDAQRILDGTTTANISKAIGREDFAFDWDEVLSRKIKDAISNRSESST